MSGIACSTEKHQQQRHRHRYQRQSRTNNATACARTSNARTNAINSASKTLIVSLATCARDEIIRRMRPAMGDGMVTDSMDLRIVWVRARARKFIQPVLFFHLLSSVFFFEILPPLARTRMAIRAGSFACKTRCGRKFTSRPFLPRQFANDENIILKSLPFIRCALLSLLNADGVCVYGVLCISIPLDWLCAP